MAEVRLKAVPILRVGDVAAAKGFYCGFLGCTVDWEHYYTLGAPVYMQVSRDDLCLHLSQNERFQHGAIIYVGVAGIDQLHAELVLRSGQWRPQSIVTTSWGTRQMEIEDPFGNLLRFNEESP